MMTEPRAGAYSPPRSPFVDPVVRRYTVSALEIDVIATHDLLRLMLLPAALLLAAAAPALTYNPQHYVNNDPVWDDLNAATVTADRAAGEYRAVFPRALQDRRDHALRIAGFILPLEASSRSAHFMVVRRNTGCPFCPPNAPTEAVEVFSDAPVSYTGQEVTATGRLKLVASSADGLFFRLEHASVVASTH